MIDGQRSHHLLNLTDGSPALWNQSVTVEADSAALADGISTAAFVMPTAKAVSWLEHLSGVEGAVVDSAGNIHRTSGMRLEAGESRRI